MPRFFLDKQSLRTDSAEIVGEDAAHIALSLRMAVGEELILCDGEGYDYRARLVSISRERVELSLLDKTPSLAEPPYVCRLYQCMPKGDKFETVIRKAVECGVTEIVPVQSSRCIAVVKDSSADKKLTRWNKIALEASKQSGRGRAVKVMPPRSYKQAIEEMTDAEAAFVCYENEDGLTLKGYLSGRKTPVTLAFLVGPEGGLSSEEVILAKEKGILSVSLGKRILRTETAAPFVLAVLTAEFEL